MTRLEKLKILAEQTELEIARIERHAGYRHTEGAVTRVLETAAKLYGVTVADILSDARPRPIVRARQEAAYMLRELELSYPQIGRVLNRDHTTALYAVRQVAARRRGRATRVVV